MTSRTALAWRRMAPALATCALAGAIGALPFPTCLFRRVTSTPCAGCGMTRAALALARLDLAASLALHPVVLPGAVALAAMGALAWALPEGHPAWGRAVRASLIGLGAALACAWALRLAGALPPV